MSGLPRIFGVEPHPRALIMGFDDATTTSLQRLFPTSRVIDSIDDVQPLEWDLLVTHKDPLSIPDHLFIVAIAEDAVPRFGLAAMPGRDYSQAPVSYGGLSRASEFTIPGGLPHRIDQLVESQLLPVARSRSANLTLWPAGAMRPFLVTSDGGAIAGSFLRLGGKAECWCLPNYISQPAAWVAAALQVWHDQDAVRFPKTDWLRTDKWRTPDENELARRLDRLRNRRSELQTKLDQEEDSLISKLSTAEREGDATHRVLLTGQGRELVEAVSAVLTSFGFRIIDMDSIWAENNRREDLRATIEGTDDWTAIIEVRGYEKGAALNDLVRLHGRFRTMFLRETGRLPDRSWYIVNQFIKQSPDERPIVLASQNRELEAYSEDGVLAVDTVDLFKLWIAVETGQASVEQVRQQLREATGRLTPELNLLPIAAGIGSTSERN